jgi:hypothetical protein
MESGTPGYAELLEVLADPGREDHDHFRSWVGGDVRSGGVRSRVVNAGLQRVR